MTDTGLAVQPHQRVLCLGNNTTDTDAKTHDIAMQQNLVNHGLLSELDQPLSHDQYQQPGLYHSSVYDLEFGRLRALANQFDLVIMLAQPKSQWSHADAYLNTVRIMRSLTVPAVFQDPGTDRDHEYFGKLVNENPSFCIFPWIELLVNHDYTTVCCRSDQPVTGLADLGDWKTDPHYQDIRQRMLRGEKLPQHCGTCYRYEDLGITSARQQETVEWANRLDLHSVQDLDTITKPVYYEVRASNRCNLQCRMCEPSSSHLIEREYKRLGLADPGRTYSTRLSTGFDIVDRQSVQKLYIAGGEPMVMPEFYAFLDQCIQDGTTDFEIMVNTNGTKLSQRLQQQLTHFANFQFIFSIDAYDGLNHYIRWPSNWRSIVANWRWLRDHGHKVTVNTTVSIYNVTQLHLLYEFIDQEFPGTLVHAQLVEHPSHLSPLWFPDAELAGQCLGRIRHTACYRNDDLFASTIDGLTQKFVQTTASYSQPLKKFFEFNDKLDQSRGIHLAHYVPELERYRP